MLKTQELTLNMGPQHPSTHGVFRCVLKLEGEYIRECVNHTGYLHRGLEKLAEARLFPIMAGWIMYQACSMSCHMSRLLRN